MANYEIVVVYTDDYAAWLDGHGYPRPPVNEGNRFPTPAQILAVLRAVPASELDISDPYVHLCPEGSGRGGPYWLRLTAPGQSSWEDETWESAEYFAIGGDYEHELRVVGALAAECGQLVVYPDSGDVALIIGRGDDPAAILSLLDQVADEPDSWFALHELRYG